MTTGYMNEVYSSLRMRGREGATMELCVARKIAPHGSMVFVQIITASYITMSMMIFVQGTSATVFLVYQFMFSTLLMSRLAFIFERKRFPPLSMKVLFGIFGLAFVGMTFAQIMQSTALYFISSTIETSILNTIPAITFILCLVTRQEKLQLQSFWGFGKLLGTAISVSGALTLIFWHESTLTLTTTTSTNWVIGLIMVIAGAVSASTWILMLAPMTRRFPAEFSMTAIMMLFATTQTGVIAAVMNPKASQWKLNSPIELLNILVGGGLATGLTNFFVTWCAGLKGPVFVASFSPLSILFTTFLDVLFLGHGITAGSIVGSILIILGLYMYLWSISKEETIENNMDIVDPENEIISSLLHNQHSDH